MKINLKSKSKSVKLEQEQFIDIGDDKKDNFKNLFLKSKKQTTTKSQLIDIISNFLTSNNNGQQLIQMKKLESLFKSSTSIILIEEFETIKILIEFIFFIQFSIGSKNVSANKSMSQVLNCILQQHQQSSTEQKQLKEIILNLSNESINKLINNSSNSNNNNVSPVFSISFLIDIINLTILEGEEGEIRIFKFIEMISNQLNGEIGQLEQASNTNAIVLHDCEHTLRSLVTLFNRFEVVLRSKVSTISKSTDITTTTTSIMVSSMRSLSIQLERILSNPTLPRQLGTNSGYLISEIITLYGNDSESIQKQILSSLVKSNNHQDDGVVSIFDILNPTTSSTFQSRFKQFPEINQISILRGLCLTGNIFSSLTNSIYNNQNENIFLNLIYKGISDYCGGTVDQHNRFISLEYLHLCILKIKEWLNNSESKNIEKKQLIKSVFPSCENYETFFNSYFLIGLDIVWKNWESSVQNISGLSNDIFDELLIIHYKCCDDINNKSGNNLKSNLFINSITTKLIDEDWYQKNKYILLKYVLEKVGPIYMIELRGNFLKNIFSAMIDHTICNSVKVFLELFIEELKKDYLLTNKEEVGSTTTTNQELNRIEKYWIYPLLEVLTETDTVTSSRIIVYALPSLLKVFPESLFKILNILINQGGGDDDQDNELNKFRNINYNIRIRISLALLNSSRQLSLIDGRELQSKYHSIIEKSLENEDESLRLLGLELICVSPKQTERITICELNLIKNFILLNLKGNSPFIRNQSLSTLYRFWIRLRESCCKVFRASTNTNINIEKDDPTMDPTSQDRYITIDDLIEYINWSCQLFAYNLYPDAPFSRKMLPLEAFSEFVDIWSSKGGQEKKSLQEFLIYIEEKSVLLYSKSSTDILINNLWDSYDRCRELSTDILMKFPSPLPGMESDEKIISFLLWAVKLACSPKARECDTGAYALKLYLKKYVFGADGLVPIFHSSTTTPVTFTKIQGNNSKAAFEFITQILRILKSQTKLASKDLLEAAKFGPMHGLILSLRYIINEINFQEFDKNKEEKKQWRVLLAEIIELMKSISSIVLRVVADLAPEGNNPNQLLKVKDSLPSSLPSGVIYDDDERLASNFSSTLMVGNDDDNNIEEGDEEDEDEGNDEDENENEELSEDIGKSEQNLKGGIGQIITVCSWQCTKQISLILGTILDKVEMPTSDEDDEVCMITTKQIEEIGHQFFTILLQSRHKGAIEKTYLGFQVLCATLMKSTNTKLSSLPSTWIGFLFERVKEQSLQITRRSAGLPFAFIGILTGESTTNQRVNHLLNHVMDSLLKLASGSDENINNNNNNNNTTDSGVENQDDQSNDLNSIEKNIYLPQVHSINILKSIFRARAIIQELDQYLAVTLICVIKAFSSKSWSVRNSATMAFSVLVDRIIGTKKLKADSTIINTTTFYHFFSRMPIVYPFLLEYFKNSLQFIKETSPLVEEGKIIQSTVYAILVLFSRLQPSNIDHPNDLLAPAQFVPLISQCCQFSNYMVRQISARALVPLISTIELIPFIRDLINKLNEIKQQQQDNQSKLNYNKIHGILLQIYHLLKGHLPTINQKEREVSISIVVSEFIPQLQWIQDSNLPPLGFIYFSILNELEKNTQNGLPFDSIINSIVNYCKNQLLLNSNGNSNTTDKFNENLKNLPMFYTWIESVLQFYLLSIKKQIDSTCTSSSSPSISSSMKKQINDELMKLFSHSLYEIKIVTMKFLLKNRSIVTEVLDQQILQTSIIKVILTDPNSTCRKKSFKLLSFLSLPLSIESVEQQQQQQTNTSSASSNIIDSTNINLYQLLCKTIWGVSNSMKKESIVLFGHYLKQFYQQNIDNTDSGDNNNNNNNSNEQKEKVLNNWIKMVKELSNSEQPLELRQAICKSIEACSDVIFKTQEQTKNDNLLSIVSIESWLAVSTLLEDDDQSIRSQCSILSSKILFLSNNPNHSTIVKDSEFVIKECSKCLEQVFDYLLSQFTNNHNYLLLRFTEILKLNYDSSSSSSSTIFDQDFQNSKVLFDKEKDNYFEEQLVKIQLINFEIQKIQSSSSSSIEKKNLLLKVMNSLEKCTAWLKNTRELNQTSVLSHWLTFNPEIFTLFYTYLVTCHSLCEKGHDYSSFINTIKSNLSEIQLHPILLMALNTLISKLENSNNNNNNNTPKNYYFLTSKQ
ncbi:hypothetical protein ACTFIW_004970 [Dictyostelium discoideum]